MTADHDELVLALDNGTQSVRALLFDARGNLHDSAQVELEPYFSTEPGYAEQHAGYYWDKLCEATNTLWARKPAAREAVRGCALTTQRGTVVCVDERGAPVRPAITYLDQRRLEGERPLGGGWGLLFALAGVQEMVSIFQANAETLWVARSEPAVWAKTHKALLLSGYLTHKLVGRFVDSSGAQVGYLPFDFKRLRWASGRDWKWACTALAPEQLPELVDPGAQLGEITAEAAEATGIPKGLPLFAAAGDKACEVLGAGALEPDAACISLGTTSTINTTRTRYIEVIPFVPPYPAAVPGAYNTEVMLFRGFWLVRWFLAQFAAREREEAVAKGVAPEALLEPLARSVPPGSLGLTVQPYWSPAVREPGPEAKGAIVGFGGEHTRAHVYRAILEGIAYAMREGRERIEQRGKVPIRRLSVAGGGSQSDVAMQITADVFNMPASRPHVYETSGLGAAIDAAVGLGLHRDFSAAVREMTRTGVTFEPRAREAALYDQLYKQVYRPLYPRLQPLYAAMRSITGYPK
ncbi:MAG: FGGY-family carbohydrate kinase [Myxococcales bacterium]|nr:FGGY-family carbohydrate kinase [Myxococcales bacterium]